MCNRCLVVSSDNPCDHNCEEDLFEPMDLPSGFVYEVCAGCRHAIRLNKKVRS
jgi:hypothetical protein